MPPADTLALTLDIKPLLEDHWTGIPVFTRRLIKALSLHGGIDLAFCCNLNLVPPDRVVAALRLGTGTFLREEIENDAFLQLGPIDPERPLLFPSVKSGLGVARREASTVHDMSTLLMPENHELENVAHHLDQLYDELATDEAVFCVSEATRQALVSAFPSAAPKTRIQYQYVDWPAAFEIMDYNAPPVAFGRYAVVIGTLEPRKNLEILFRSLDRPETRDGALRFVVIGRKGWKVDASLASLSQTAREHLIFTGFVTEYTKYRLLKGCEFLIYPSVYEGFGIPALEALSLGKPVLAAMTSSLPEVIGDAGVYFDPFDVREFADGLAQAAAMAKKRKTASIAIKSSLAFDWQRMAEPVVKWLRE